MVGRHAPAGDVHDHQARNSGGGRFDHAQGDTGPREVRDLPAAQVHGHNHRAVGPVLGHEHAHVPVPLGWRLRVVHHGVVAVLVQDRYGAGQPAHHGGPGHVVNEYGDCSVAPSGESRRHPIRAVLQPLNRLEYPLAGVLTDVWAVIDHT
jgi:hypothetical protein